MKKFISIITLLLLCLGMLLGCSGDKESPTATSRPGTSQNEPTEIPSDIQQMLDSRQVEEQAVAEFVKKLPTQSGDEFASYDIFAVTFFWGAALPNAPTADWSGGVMTNAVGKTNLVHAIDFDEGEDFFVDPPNATALEWVSFTTQDVDGVILLVAVDLTLDYFAAPFLSFHTETFTKQFYFDELEELAEFYMLDDGNMVTVLSKALWRNTCPGGMIDGNWIKESMTGDQGTIEGTWTDMAGNPVGLMSGRFWIDDYGFHKFAGSVSGVETDEVIAKFEGRWMYDDYRLCALCGTGHGLFHGKYRYLADDKKGYMHGTFGDYTLPVDELALPIQGVWQDGCRFGFALDED